MRQRPLWVGARGGSSPQPEDDMALSPDLLNILACPACKGDLEYDAEAQTLTCQRCRLRYRVVDDIPVLLVEKAEKF